MAMPKSLLTVFFALNCAAAAEIHPPKIDGVHYSVRVFDKPRPVRLHVLRVDLRAGTIVPRVVVASDPDDRGPAEAMLTDPLKLAAVPGAVAFINCNPWGSLPDAVGKRSHHWFAGKPVQINGLAVSG